MKKRKYKCLDEEKKEKLNPINPTNPINPNSVCLLERNML